MSNPTKIKKKKHSNMKKYLLIKYPKNNKKYVLDEMTSDIIDEIAKYAY